MSKENKIIILGVGNKDYRLDNKVYDKNGICPCLVAAMGMGGGYIPLVIEIEKVKENGDKTNRYIKS